MSFSKNSDPGCHPGTIGPAAKRSSRKATRWRLIVGIALLVLLIKVAGPTALVEVLGRISPRWALITLAIAGLWLFLGGLNVWLLLRRLAAVRLRVFVAVYMVSWAMTNIVPGQFGDVAQIALLRRHNIPLAKSSAAYLVDKFVSLVFMLMVAAFGVGLYTEAVSGWWLMILPFLGTAGALAGLVLLRRLEGKPGGRLERFKALVERLIDELAALRREPRALILNVVLTITKWITVGLKYLCAFKCFGTALPFVATATIPVVSSLVGYIPVTVGGIGTTEWTAAALFARAGADAATVVGVYLFLRAALLLVAAVLFVGFRGDRLMASNVSRTPTAS